MNEKITRAFYSAKLVLKEKAPDILFWTGLTTMVGGTVFAATQTRKLDAILEDAYNEFDSIHNGDLDEEAESKELFKAYVKYGLKIAKLYSPAAACTAAGAMCLFASHKEMKNRNASLVAAYSALDSAYRGYRQKVAEKIGAEEEKKIALEEPKKEFEIDDNGEVISTKYMDDKSQYSPYARLFVDYTTNEYKSGMLGVKFLKGQEEYANFLLKSRGYLFLHEVYELLGFELSEASSFVGWRYDENNPNPNFVSFGIDLTDNRVQAFMNGDEEALWLDFNCYEFMKDMVMRKV